MKLLRTLEGHKAIVFGIAFDPAGQMLASGSNDDTVRLWDTDSGKLLRTLKGHEDFVASLAFAPAGRLLASGSYDDTVKLWNADSGKLLRTLKGHLDSVFSLAFDPAGRMLASGSGDDTIRLWDADSGKLLRSLEEQRSFVLSVAFNPAGQTLASGSSDGTVRLWNADNGKLLRTLEGHTSGVFAVAFSADGRLLASKSNDGTLRIWPCKSWKTAAAIPGPTDFILMSSLAFHPTLTLLASVGSEPDAPEGGRSRLIHFWELDLDVLLGQTLKARPASRAAHHTTAKIVLVGDSGVGKTGLGWRLAHGEYKEHSSTHGQQFWVLGQLSARRSDNTDCEAILWDLAGQPDYRLTHALFLDDADLALILFDPTDSRDPLHGVEFWLKQLKSGRAKSSDEQGCCPTILVGARADRGEARLTQEELDDFCKQRGIPGGYLATSAKAEIGLDELLRRMKAQIPWDQKSATVTTITFKRIKDHVLSLKENRRRRKLIVSPEDLRKTLEKTGKRWKFTDAEMMTAVKHLANYGYAHVLRTSKGEERILLTPELLNNLAASFVLEARRNVKGLGSLDEKQLLEGKYPFPELEKLYHEERDVLLDSAALGTGLVALPLAAKGIEVCGIDSSQAMVSRLRAKPGGDAISVTMGDFADVSVEGEFSLIFVVFNTFFALGSQKEQVRCFRNAAAHLAAGGAFLIEAFVPDASLFSGERSLKVTAVTDDRVGFKVSHHDPSEQRIKSQHIVIRNNEIKLYPVEVRYAWPSELDLMAEMAGLRLGQRWSNWNREEFRAGSEKHISVYERIR